MNRRPLILVAASLAFLTACQAGPSGPDRSADAADGDLERACAAFAAADCAAYLRCSPFFFGAVHADEAACVARRRLLCVLNQRLPGSADTPASLHVCAEALRSQPCPENMAADNFAPSPCVLPGTLSDGSPCASSAQCQSGLCRRTTTSCGACAAKLPAGSACVNPSDCQRGLDCLRDTDEGERRCVALAQAGAPCRVVAGLSNCLPTLRCEAGRCAPALPVGAACDPTSEEDPCDLFQGAACSEAGRCTQWRVGRVGEACGDGGLCSAGARCFGPTGTRRCVAPAADGARCDTNRQGTGPGCLLGATCDGPAAALVCAPPGSVACR